MGFRHFRMSAEDELLATLTLEQGAARLDESHSKLLQHTDGRGVSRIGDADEAQSGGGLPHQFQRAVRGGRGHCAPLGFAADREPDLDLGRIDAQVQSDVTDEPICRRIRNRKNGGVTVSLPLAREDDSCDRSSSRRSCRLGTRTDHSR